MYNNYYYSEYDYLPLPESSRIFHLKIVLESSSQRLFMMIPEGSERL
jgi:hypothetical protein